MFVGGLKFGGVAVALIGAAVFGWYFLRGNAQTARNNSDKVPSSSWRTWPKLRRKYTRVGYGPAGIVVFASDGATRQVVKRTVRLRPV